MRFSLIAVPFALFLLLGMGPDAYAKRLGGGSSFGGKPSYSQPWKGPAVSPRTAIRPEPQTARQPGASNPVLMRSPGYGAGGLLMGGLLGSFFWGGPFMGFSMFDILFLGLLIFILVRLFVRRGPGGRNVPPPPRPSEPVDPREASEAYRRAQAAWDFLRSSPGPAGEGNQATPRAATGSGSFDAAEFLKGAKLAYVRIQEAWAERDLEDIRQFLTPEMLRQIEAKAASDPHPSPVEILLVEAKLLDLEEGGVHTAASVQFDVLLREDRTKDRPEQTHEVWRFRRDAADPASMWLLDGIQQVQ